MSDSELKCGSGGDVTIPSGLKTNARNGASIVMEKMEKKTAKAFRSRIMSILPPYGFSSRAVFL